MKKMVRRLIEIARYDWAGNSVDTWTGSADSLLAAASVLRRAREAVNVEAVDVGDPIPDDALTHPVEIMLRGFAVECLLKALWVSRGNHLAQSGILQKISGVGSHNLVQLAHKLGLDCTDAEKDLLKRLAVFMTGIGRYPISAHWVQTQIQNVYGGGEASPTYWQTPSDYDTFVSIVSRINIELNK
jgi:hypothetical protein